MVRFTRSGTLKGAFLIPQAVGWATELNSYFNSKYDVELHFGLQVGGICQMVWYVEVDSMAKYEEVTMKTMEDTKYWEIVNQGKDFWVEGSLQDTLVKMIG